MHNDEMVHSIRAFNRIYMPSMNLLGNHYLDSEYSVSEMRVIFEIFENQGCSAIDITKITNLDKGYLSRIIKKLENQGYVYRQVSKTDKRVFCLFLTKLGIKRTQEFIQKSDEEIEEIINYLTDNEQKQLLHSVNTIQNLLSTIQKRKDAK